MGRSIKKGPHVSEKLISKVQKLDAAGETAPVKTWERSSMIIPEFVGHSFEVHNGRHFIKVFVTEDMVGHRLGEFAPTRTFRGHKKKQ